MTPTISRAGSAAGVLRSDVDPGDLLVAISGIALAAGEPTQAGRLLDLLMDGLRLR